jgi:heterodisulfide reductase subunit A
LISTLALDIVKNFTFANEDHSVKVSQPMDKALTMEGNTVIGSVMIVGGGIAGMQAALDLADSGYKVYLVEKNPAIGGSMAQLDKTFPTNDCSM